MDVILRQKDVGLERATVVRHHANGLYLYRKAAARGQAHAGQQPVGGEGGVVAQGQHPIFVGFQQHLHSGKVVAAAAQALHAALKPPGVLAAVRAAEELVGFGLEGKGQLHTCASLDDLQPVAVEQRREGRSG